MTPEREPVRAYDRAMSDRLREAFVKDPREMRMGSPQYGDLVLDGETFRTEPSVESESLLWSDDERLLAGQELISWQDGPQTRVIVIDAKRRELVAASEAHYGLCNPVRFEADGLTYRHWHHNDGERELLLNLPPRELLDAL
jgi:hypothetical protein